MTYMTPAHAQKKTLSSTGENAPATYANGRGGTTLEAAFQARSVGCRLEYHGVFREGSICYVESLEGRPSVRIVFQHRACRPHLRGCRFVVYLPDVANWETATGTSLARRDDIVDFVAETVRREEAGSWRYEVEADRIRYF